MKHLPRLCTLLASLLLLAGCRPRPTATPCNDGVELMETDPDQAALLFHQAILQQDSPAVAHYMLAALAEGNSREIPLRIYHLEQYLALMPEAPNAEETRQKLTQCRTIYRDRLEKAVNDTTREQQSVRLQIIEEYSIRQKKWIESLDAENRLLREQLADLQNKLRELQR